jgi:hypothetical protein
MEVFQFNFDGLSTKSAVLCYGQSSKWPLPEKSEALSRSIDWRTLTLKKRKEKKSSNRK